MEEAIVCEVLPLDFHLALSVKEKIWKLIEFIDKLCLLLSVKDAVKRAKKKIGE